MAPSQMVPAQEMKPNVPPVAEQGDINFGHREKQLAGPVDDAAVQWPPTHLLADTDAGGKEAAAAPGQRQPEAAAAPRPDEAGTTLPVTPRTEPQSSRSGTQHQHAHMLLEIANVREVAQTTSDGATKLLQKAAFEDTRWKQALEHIASNEHWATKEHVQLLLVKGANAFGFWHLSQDVIDVLAQHVMQNKSAALTPALQTWANDVRKAVPSGQLASSLNSRNETEMDTEDVTEATKKQKKINVANLETHAPKYVLFGIIAVLSIAYACEVVFVMYPRIMRTLSYPLFAARAAGMAALLWTACLFLTMSRTAIKSFAKLVCCQCLQKFIDDHKEMHIFCGKMMFVSAGCHIFSHLIGTVPGLISKPLEEINDIIGCANPDTTKGYLGVEMPLLELPDCPLTERPSYMRVIFGSTPGISGLILTILAAIVGYTARQAGRTAHFEQFIFTHYVMFPCWLVLLFVHGSNGWIGVGFPLVVFIVAPFVAMYALDRALRLVRYYCHGVSIVDVVIRSGPKNKAKGSLVNLMITKPSTLWTFEDGMYAFLCMPEYAPGQWHPFTVCSGKQDPTVDFIINGVGDWTCALSQRCLDAYEGKASLPKIAMDGPYLAPTVTAKNRRVFVAVGAGVGITPFLSLMSAISGVLTDKKAARLPLQEAHFYWMTRSADDFLFGRRLFSKIMSNSKLRDKMFLHLHVTQKEPEKNVAAYIFREAVRRQSKLDRELFDRTAVNFEVSNMIAGGPQMPWCWANLAKDDLLWVTGLLDCKEEDDAALLEVAGSESHWAIGFRKIQSNAMSATASGVGAAGQSMGTPPNVLGAINESDDTPRDMSFKGLFSKAAPATHGQAIELTRESAYMPVSFGRPDFMREIYSIGSARPQDDVHVYVCGQTALVQSLQTVCAACTEQAQERARKTGAARAQTYEVHFERFG